MSGGKGAVEKRCSVGVVSEDFLLLLTDWDRMKRGREEGDGEGLEEGEGSLLRAV